jgi:holo-[acyl-carrier protein] synthase
MAIVGHGVDVVETPRIERLLSEEPDAFSGWFTSLELEQLAQDVHRGQSVSGRIAAKEAVAKALGTGFSQGVSWQDIRITTNELGAPQVELADGAQAAAHKAGIIRILLSISHGRSLAIASAIALSD